MFALRGDSGDGCVGRKANGGLDDGEWKEDVASMVLGRGAGIGRVAGGWWW